MEMRSVGLILALAVAVGCGDKGGGGADDTGGGGDDGADDDTGAATGPVDADGDGATADVDCDDANPDIHPDAQEICDGIDNDCDGATDDADDSVTGLSTFYGDADGDGYGAADRPVEACAARPGRVDNALDCDDASSAIHPDAAEVCDAIDNDCDGRVNGPDADGAVDWYADADADGYGDATQLVATECPADAPSGAVQDTTDCNDANAAVHPGATDAWYDGVDSDCAGDDDYDADADGEQSDAHGGTDCDDADATINTAATETWYDGVDQDCRGDGDYDADADGYDSDAYSGEDCDDTDAAAYPGAADTWYDGVDSDCAGDGDYDADADGYDSDAYSGTDCDDADASVHPYVLEVSTDTDGVDNDCDGNADAADTDAQLLELGDDATETVTLAAVSFPFCGADYTEITVDSNGRLRFDGGASDFSETGSEWDDVVGIAPFWDDLDPTSSAVTGGVYVVEYSDAVGVYWEGVPAFGSTTPETFSVLLWDDGSFWFDYPSVSQSCGAGTLEDTTDLSEAVAHHGALGIGDGAEDMVYEWFGYVVSGGTTSYGGTSNDLDGSSLEFCGTGGDDVDGDGYTTECGDPDDNDTGIIP